MASRDSLRIVHCVRSPIGGIFRHIADLAVEQAKAGHQVGLICDSLTGGRFEDEHIARLKPSLELGVERIPMRREIRPSDVAASWAVFRRISRLAPEILHGHGSKGGAYVRMIGTALRLLGDRPLRFYCPHGGSLHYHAGSAGGRAIFVAERLLERLTDGLIFVSGYERDQYCIKVGAPRIPSWVVYNGLSEAEFIPVEPAPTARDFLFIGMLRDIKGPDVFIRAIRALKDTGLTVTAHIVGDGPEREAYRELAHRLDLCGQVAFHAPMPARQAFRMARSIVVPSRGESMPYIVLEAAAARMPIIATAVGGIPEIFDGESDELVAPGDVDALAAAMRVHALNNDPVRRSAEARATRVARRFSVTHMAEMIERAYRTALSDDRESSLEGGLIASNKRT